MTLSTVRDTVRYYVHVIIVFFFLDNDVNILEDEGEDERSELVVLDPMHVSL